jgi:hypothetical protein
LKNTKGKKNITERKSTWKITKELRHPPIVTGKYITYFFNNFMGNHGELVEKNISTSLRCRRIAYHFTKIGERTKKEAYIGPILQETTVIDLCSEYGCFLLSIR